jgi:hypothetical protein
VSYVKVTVLGLDGIFFGKANSVYAPRGVNDTDNFCSGSASVSVFEDMVCIFRNSKDMDADSGQADTVADMVLILSDG